VTPSRLTSLRHRLEYAIVMAVRALAGALPMRLSHAMGTAIGLIFYVVDAGHRRLARAQLAAAFPTRSAAECRRIAQRTFAHFGQMVVAVLRASTQTPEEVLRHIEVEGEERVRDGFAAGKGVIIYVGHFGFWELHGLVHGLVVPPLAVLARPLDNRLLEVMLERVRTSTGNTVIYRQGALRKVIRVLEANGAVAIPIDQHIQGTNAVWVDFFDRPASTTSAVASLALRTGAPLIGAFALPLPGGRFRMIYESPVELPSQESGDPIRELSQRCSDVLEMYVRRHPHLWLWMHRRWRDLPAGSAEGVRDMFPAPAAEESEAPE
jgi:Kdo2-lipid IVA lauroyltransferase/acyltransferase